MLSAWQAIIDSLLPVHCAGCGKELHISPRQWLCFHCLASLSPTDYHQVPLNPVFTLFMHQPAVVFATACYFFHHDGLMQRIIHQIKYAHHQQLAIWMGQRMGHMLAPQLSTVDLIIPVPLHPRKLRKRGYNQSALLARSMAHTLGIPVEENILIRKKFTETQTHKTRQARQENVAQAFQLTASAQGLSGQHLLLIDDVLTTGATLNACVNTLSLIPNIRISIATLAIAQ
ncbi:MAG: ComF family protein [Thermoflavifilum sp.]|nr:ComF family protein [Thermoflavifilum sp.]